MAKQPGNSTLKGVQISAINSTPLGTEFLPITDPASAWNRVLTQEVREVVQCRMASLRSRQNDAVLFEHYARTLLNFVPQETCGNVCRQPGAYRCE